MKIDKGTILISQPYLGDPNFDWTTLLLCDHNDEGSYGFVLNDKSNLLIKDVVAGFEDTDYELFIGGPVEQDALFYIHKIKGLRGAVEICEGIYVHGDFDELKARIALGEVKKEDVRFFLGYSGWSGGQLQEELIRKSWFINNTHSRIVLDMDVNTLWRDILKLMGGKYKKYVNYPLNPNDN